MLVIEGPDCIGKTTLVERVRARWDALATEGRVPGMIQDVMHLTQEHAKWAPHDYVKACRPLTIADRFHLSEVVYGEETRNGSRLGPRGFAIVHGAVRAAGGMLVVLHSDKQTYNRLMDDHHDRGEDYCRKDCAKVAKAFHVVALSIGGRFSLSGATHSGALAFDARYDLPIAVTSNRLSPERSMIRFANADDVECIVRMYALLQKTRCGIAEQRTP